MKCNVKDEKIKGYLYWSYKPTEIRKFGKNSVVHIGLRLDKNLENVF